MNVTLMRAALLCGTAIYVAGPAMAQDQSPAGAPASQTAPKVASTQLEEVVVTARRRDERLQDVPVSVSAFSTQALQRSTVQELRSINVLTPGLTFTNEGGSAGATLTLRGIGQIPLGEGTPGVVIYVNNEALPPQGSNVPTYDIASVQVLKGPQGTLFGKNTLGGAVVVSSKAPNYKFGGYVQGTYGSWNYRTFEGAVNIPLVEDKVALRVAGQLRRQDARNHSFDGNVGYGDIHEDGGRVSLLLEPIHNLKSTTIAEYFLQDEHSNAPYLLRREVPFSAIFANSPIAFVGPLLDAQVAAELANQHAHPNGTYDDGSNGGLTYTRSKSIINDTSYTVDHITFRNIVGYREIKTFDGGNSGGVGGLTVPLGPGGALIPFTVFHGTAAADRSYLTNETQVLGDFDRFKFIAGFYYNHDKPHGPGGSQFTAFSVGAVPAPAVTSQVENKNKAIYGQVGYKITNQLTLNVGGRYSWDDVSACGGHVPGVAGLATDAQCRAVAGLNNPTDGVGTIDNSSKNPAYTIGLDYKVTPDWMLYVQHRRGFRAANVNTPLFETEYTTTDPCTTPAPGKLCFNLKPFQKTGVEKLIDFEVGSKASFDLGGARARWNISAYYDKYKNALQFLNTTTLIQAVPPASVPDSPDRSSVGINVADETIWGIETDATIALTPDFSVSANAAYTHVSVDSVTLPAGFPPGIFTKADVNTYSPTFSGTLSASWTLPIHPLDGDVIVNGDIFTTAAYAGQGGEKLPGYHVANARIDWKNFGGTQIDLGFYVRNLTDESYFQGEQVILHTFPTNTVFLAPPRSFGVSARYSF